MSRNRKVALLVGALGGVALLVALAFLIRGLLTPKPEPVQVIASPTPQVRTLGNDRFGPRARLQSAINVDVGVRTVAVGGSPSPSAAPRAAAVTLAQYSDPGTIAQPSPGPSATPTTQTAPIPPLPVFGPLPATPAGQTKELAIVFAKGAASKRQVYIRSIDRDRDDQLVSSPYDDYGVAFASATQKVAFYSNEEGASDAARPKTKLKVVDLATGKVFPIANNLPGEWPVAWSNDGKKLAIPTANSVFISDVTTGRSFQIPTGTRPGGIVWAPGNLKIFFQADVSDGNTDIFEADAITAQARGVATGPGNETLPAISVDGSKLAFFRSKSGDQGSVTVKALTTGQEETYEDTEGAASYLWNRDFTGVIFVKRDGDGKLVSLDGDELRDIGGPDQSTVIGWDRDYDHVFVLAGVGETRDLYSINTTTGDGEKIKEGVSSSATGT